MITPRAPFTIRKYSKTAPPPKAIIYTASVVMLDANVSSVTEIVGGMLSIAMSLSDMRAVNMYDKLRRRSGKAYFPNILVFNEVPNWSVNLP